MSYKTKLALRLIVALTLVIGGCLIDLPITEQADSTQKPILTSPEYTPSLSAGTQSHPTLSPSPIPEYTLRVTPHAVTPFATISYADARRELMYMLQTNGDCALPCFWGIQPEITRYDDLYRIIDRFGGRNFYETVEANGQLRVYANFMYEGTDGVMIDSAYSLQDDIVKDMKVLLLNLWKPEVAPEDWSAYNIDHILKTYGVPDKVGVGLGVGGALKFHFRLKYESLDTFITYTWSTKEDKYLTPTSAIFCPEEIILAGVTLHMGKNPFNAGPDGVPIMEATGVTEQDFYELFTETPSACLTLNQDAMGW